MAVQTQLVTVTIQSAPSGTPTGVEATIDCLLELGEYSQERGKTEYNCMSSNDSYVGLGAITRSPLNFKMLYNEDAADGQKILKDNFNTNTEIQAKIEFNNSGGNNGTTLTGIFGISKFNMDFPKDGNIGAAFDLQFIGSPTLTEAS